MERAARLIAAWDENKKIITQGIRAATARLNKDVAAKRAAKKAGRIPKDQTKEAVRDAIHWAK